jgi:hypothetical protein
VSPPRSPGAGQPPESTPNAEDRLSCGGAHPTLSPCQAQSSAAAREEAARVATPKTKFVTVGAMPVDDREWDQHHREVRHRLSWTGLVSNGAAIVAMVGGAAQSDKFLAIVYIMTVPLALFGLGAASGLVAEEISLKADIEWKRGTAWWENEDGPAKESVRINKRLIEMQDDGSILKPENAPEVLNLTSRGKEAAQQAQEEGPKSIRRVRLSVRLNRGAAVVRWLSLSLCGIGFAAMLATANPSVRQALPWTSEAEPGSSLTPCQAKGSGVRPGQGPQAAPVANADALVLGRGGCGARRKLGAIR